ncbi:EamA family transporter [Natronorubrum sp. JWXQ-INN-674]|uniref:EamA family transporter n=1 Tax=Natronorubrum halalkaliphilum TaxID=2691917 RepID=A0A6B0VLT3_9EURY|nr:EamA family transporter [Natronorubrum halalkaliphilum]
MSARAAGSTSSRCWREPRSEWYHSSRDCVGAVPVTQLLPETDAPPRRRIVLLRVNIIVIYLTIALEAEGVASTRYTTVGLFVLLAAIWGLSFVAARAALADVSPVLLAALRFDIAALLLFGYAAVTTTRLVPANRREWSTVAIGGFLFIALHHALLFAGQQYVTSAVAAVVICLDPILAAGFARVLLPQERLSWVGGVGLLLGVVGVGIIARPSPDAALRADVVGVVLVFLAAAAFALGAVVTRRARTGTDFPAQSMQAWMMLIGAVMLHAGAIVLPGEEFVAITWSWSVVAGLGYLAVIAAGVGYFLYFELLERLGAIEINLVAYVTPIFAAIGGWLALGEQLQAQVVAGFGVILVGFVLVKRQALRAELDKYRA